MTRTQISNEAIAFFVENAGISYDLKIKTEEQDKLNNARHLAEAEQHAKEYGWTVEWAEDDLPYKMGDAEAAPQEMLCAVLKDSHGEVLASLGGIADPSNAYCRVVGAELALEAISDAPERFKRRVSTLADDLQECLTHVGTGYDGVEINDNTVEPIKKSALAMAELAAMLLDKCYGTKRRKSSYIYRVRKALGYVYP